MHDVLNPWAEFGRRVDASNPVEVCNWIKLGHMGNFETNKSELHCRTSFAVDLPPAVGES